METYRLLIIVMAITMALQCVSAILHRVGGRSGWTPNGVNYTEWAAKERFYVDEWLLFNFDKNIYNVLEVNQTNYEKCREEEFITNITRGGRDVFQLLEARPYYFLSGRGFCWSGMKLAISVQQAPPPPTPSPPPSSKTASPFPTTTSGSITLLLSFSIAMLFWAL